MNDVIPSRGAIMSPLFIEIVRSLNKADLLDLINAPKQSVPMLQRLRAKHHRMATLLAEGKSNKQTAAIVGCTPQRITQLLSDPTFTELVSYYRDQTLTTHLEDSARIQAKLVDASEMALDEIIDRLEDDSVRKTMPASELRQITQLGVDRTVAPPKSTDNKVTLPTEITLNFGTVLGPPVNNSLDKPINTMVDITPAKPPEGGE